MSTKNDEMILETDNNIINRIVWTNLMHFLIIIVLSTISFSSCGNEIYKSDIDLSPGPVSSSQTENEIVLYQDDDYMDITKKTIGNFAVTVDSSTKKIDLTYKIASPGKDERVFLKRTIGLRRKSNSQSFVLEETLDTNLMELTIINSGIKLPSNVTLPAWLHIDVVTDRQASGSASYRLYDGSFIARTDPVYKQSDFDAFVRSISKSRIVDKTIPTLDKNELVFVVFKDRTVKAFSYEWNVKMFVPILNIRFEPYEFVGVQIVEYWGPLITNMSDFYYALVFKGEDGYRTEYLDTCYGNVTASFEDMQLETAMLSTKLMKVIFEDEKYKVVTNGKTNFVINKTTGQLDCCVDNSRFVLNKNTGFMGMLHKSTEKGPILYCKSLDGSKQIWERKLRYNCLFKTTGTGITFVECDGNFFTRDENDDQNKCIAFRLDGQTGKVLWTIAGKPGEDIRIDERTNRLFIAYSDELYYIIDDYDIESGKLLKQRKGK